MRVNFGFLCDHFGHKDGKPSAEGIGLDAFSPRTCRYVIPGLMPSKACGSVPKRPARRRWG